MFKSLSLGLCKVDAWWLFFLPLPVLSSVKSGGKTRADPVLSETLTFLFFLDFERKRAVG